MSFTSKSVNTLSIGKPLMRSCDRISDSCDMTEKLLKATRKQASKSSQVYIGMSSHWYSMHNYNQLYPVKTL